MKRLVSNGSFWIGALGCLVCFGLLQLVSNLPWAKGQAASASLEKGPTASESRSGSAAVLDSTPRRIPFQAYLTDTNGRPVEGQHNLTFKLYDVTESGSDLGWTETHTNVPVSKGIVNVLLGSITPFGSLLFNASRYIGISIDGGMELVPRQQLIPAIHAADSDRARQLVKPGTLDPAVTVDASGNVGIGTTTPQERLHIVGPGGGLLAQCSMRTDVATVAVKQQRAAETSGTFAMQYWGDSAPGTSDAGLPFANLVRLTAAANAPSAVEINGSISPIVFGTGSTPPNERMRISPNGNVGIGAVNPQVKLDVNGDVKAHSLIMTDGLLYASDPGMYYVKVLPATLEIAGNIVGINTQGQRRATFNWDGMNFLYGTTCIHDLRTTGCDVAETFDVNETDCVKPGMVVSIDPDNPGQLRLARKAYDHKVAGIISGANGLTAGVTLGGATSPDVPKNKKAPSVALSGRVYCWCDASNGAIEPGDLLTTSDTPGHAMKVTDHARATGAVLGKAMLKLEKGKGLVLVLVSLQ